MVKERQRGKFISLLNKREQRENNSVNINNRARSSSYQAQVKIVENNSGNNSENGNNMFRSNSNQAQVNHNSNSINSKWVINLSSHPLTPAQVSLLSKGPNFALAPNNPPNVEFISAIELACQKLTEQDVQELRAEVNIILRKAKPPKSNISREEKEGS